MVSYFSTLCSFAGASLFGAIFFGLADILDYRNTKLVYESAHYLVIAAVVLFSLAFLLSFFKKDSKQNHPVVATQMNVGESVQFENNRIANNLKKLSQTDDLKAVESNKKVKQGSISENIKLTDISSKVFKNSSVIKKEEIVALPSSTSSKNLHADESKQRGTANRLLSNISSKTHKHADISKQVESKRNLVSHTSSKTLQQASTSKHEQSSSILSLNSSYHSLQKQTDSAKVLSPGTSSKLIQHASISEQRAKTLSSKPRSQSMSEKPSHFDRQLVPYEKQPEIPFCGQNLQTSPYQARNFYEFMPSNASVYGPVTEVTATKRVTVAAWGVTQEEYQIHQRTFYHAPRNQVGGFSPQFDLRPTLNYVPSSGGVQESQINQTTFYQYPSHLGGKFASNVSRPEFDNNQTGIASSMSNQPYQNKVSDVQTRLESMNFFH